MPNYRHATKPLGNRIKISTEEGKEIDTPKGKAEKNMIRREKKNLPPKVPRALALLPHDPWFYYCQSTITALLE